MASIPDPAGPGPDVAGAEGGGGDDGDGDYEVGAVLREGWGGTLRAGRYRRSGRPVTLQEIRADLAATPGLIDRLGRIGRQVAGLRDPHLLAVYDLVDDQGVYRLVAEWSEAPVLAATLERVSLTPERAVAVVDEVLAGLVALHGSRLFHGRVGPDTVVLENDTRARLAELAVCAAASPEGTGPETDVRDTARMGLRLLRDAGPRFDALRRPLEGAADATGTADAARLREELAGSATRVLGGGGRWAAAATPAPPTPRRRRRLLAALLAAVVVLAAAAAVGVYLVTGHGAPIAHGPLVLGSDAALAVNPAVGGCNTTFAFVARGSLSGVGTLVYRWEQSDGQVTDSTSIPIGPTEGAYQLVEAWRLEGSQTVDGTMTLHILKPVERKLTRSFHYSCR